MTDYERPFNAQDVEEQVDQLSSSNRGTDGSLNPDRRFLHDLRLILEAGNIDAQLQKDARSLQRAWDRLTAAGISPHTIQPETSRADTRRFIAMTTVAPKSDHAVPTKNTFKHRLSTLAAVIATLMLLAGAVAIFARAPHNQSARQQQGTTRTGTARTSAVPSDVKLGTTIYVFQQPGMPVYGLQWSADGTRITSSGDSIYSWDAFNGSHKVQYAASSSGSALLSTQLSPDGKTLAVWKVSEIDLYNTATGEQFKTLTYPFQGETGDKAYLAHFAPYMSWSPDGKLLRTLVQLPTDQGSLVNKIETYNIATGARQEMRLNLSEQLDQVAWSPNGKYVAVGRPAEGTVSVIDLATGGIVSNQHAGAPIETIEVNWSPDSKQLIANFGSGGLYVWDAATAKQVVIYQAGMEPVWSPNGKYIAMADGSLIKILDASNGHLLYTYAGQKGDVYAIAWSPNSDFIASGGGVNGDSVVNVWAAHL